MESLRRVRFIARLVLAWFALSVGIAIASPILNPQGLKWVCSAAGTIKLLATNDGGSAHANGHTPECPVCSTTGAPPPVAVAFSAVPLPLSRAVQSIPAARIAWLTAAPLPARGPPFSLAT